MKKIVRTPSKMEVKVMKGLIEAIEKEGMKKEVPEIGRAHV